MYSNRGKSNYRSQIHRVTVLRTMLIILVVALVVGIPLFVWAGIKKEGKSIERKQLLEAWENKDFASAYSASLAALEAKPMDYFLLTTNGFSAFQVGISQPSNSDMLEYLDKSIWALRKAVQLKDAANDGRVFYVLGKAYYHKGEDFYDLAIKNLETAQDMSYDAADIPEYLGLAYFAIGDYRSSVEAFTRALTADAEPSDKLLLAIARAYMALSAIKTADNSPIGEINAAYLALNETETARAYLMRCVEISRDINAIVTARFLLADIYITAGNLDAAETQYLAILDSTGDNAEAYYQLGELYLRKGDNTRARAYWRQSRAADPAHQKARIRLNQ